MSNASYSPLQKQPPPQKPSLDWLRDEIERLKWRQRLAAVVVILLGLAGLIGYTVWLAILTANENSQQTTIDGIRNNVTDTQLNVMQLILELNGNVTVLQTGTVGWTLATVLSSGSNPACVTPADYINQGPGGVGSLIDGTYVLQNVQLGSLNFTVLELTPPVQPLIYTLPSDIAALIQVCVVNFSPTVDILDTINTDAPINVPPVFEFTASNLARIISVPDCLLAQNCFIKPYFQVNLSVNISLSHLLRSR